MCYSSKFKFGKTISFGQDEDQEGSKENLNAGNKHFINFLRRYFRNFFSFGF